MSTEYVLLGREGDGRWTERPERIVASSTESAIRQAGKAGEWVAIPARSFRPVTVEVETVERVRFSELGTSEEPAS